MKKIVLRALEYTGMAIGYPIFFVLAIVAGLLAVLAACAVELSD